MEKEKQGSVTVHKILNIAGIVLCVILVPILILNCVLLIKGVADPENVPSVGGVAPMIVLTDSMKGTFDGGDLVFIKMAEPEDVKEKDVISYYDKAAGENAVTTHRVERIVSEDGKLYFMTFGDANKTSTYEQIPAEELIGIYTGFHIPNAGHVAMFMQTTWGFVVCVFVPIILLVGYDLIRRKLYDKKHGEDKDKLLAELEELRALKAAQEGAKTEAEAKVEEAPADESTPKE